MTQGRDKPGLTGTQQTGQVRARDGAVDVADRRPGIRSDFFSGGRRYLQIGYRPLVFGMLFEKARKGLHAAGQSLVDADDLLRPRIWRRMESI